MAIAATDILAQILAKPKDIEHVRALTTSGVKYVSPNYEDANVHRVMPWAGTSYGPEAIVQTFTGLGRFGIVENSKSRPWSALRACDDGWVVHHALTRKMET